MSQPEQSNIARCPNCRAPIATLDWLFGPAELAAIPDCIAAMRDGGEARLLAAVYCGKCRPADVVAAIHAGCSS
jgi:hypothetical protein